MSIAIKTAFMGPTNTKGDRIKATTMHSSAAHRVSITLAWDYGLSADGNHAAAASALARQLKWAGDWHMADGGDCYLWVRVAAYDMRISIEA